MMMVPHTDWRCSSHTIAASGIDETPTMFLTGALRHFGTQIT